MTDPSPVQPVHALSIPTSTTATKAAAPVVVTPIDLTKNLLLPDRIFAFEGQLDVFGFLESFNCALRDFALTGPDFAGRLLGDAMPIVCGPSCASQIYYLVTLQEEQSLIEGCPEIPDEQSHRMRFAAGYGEEDDYEGHKGTLMQYSGFEAQLRSAVPQMRRLVTRWQARPTITTTVFGQVLTCPNAMTYMQLEYTPNPARLDANYRTFVRYSKLFRQFGLKTDFGIS